jgi:hypothetical protein
VAVLGVARNCEPYLPAALANLSSLASCYDDARFVFAVSDSTDGTATCLQDWLGTERKGTVLQLGALEPQLPVRPVRIAANRNACLDELQRSGARFDHLLVADLDEVLSVPVSRNAFQQAADWLDASEERVAVTANATPRYYDTWALRHELWCPYDVWQQIGGRLEGCSFEAAKFREVLCRQIVLPPHLPPIRVRSAFGGLGLYKAAPALSARYRGLDELGQPTCEHVTFNQAITAAGGQIHIFPALQVCAPPEHLFDPSQFALRWRMAMRGKDLLELCLPSWRRFARPLHGTAGRQG